jgi:hypothetical protein
MIFSILQIAAIAAVAIFLARWRVSAGRRNIQSWEALVARLQPCWSGRELSEHFLAREGLSVSPEEIWDRMHGAQGLWAMYRNAGVMLEMAHYAARNSASFDSELLASVRSDLVQIRVGALMALAQFALNKASDTVRFSAFQVASQYTGMAARMTQFLQENASALVPEFIAAM